MTYCDSCLDSVSEEFGSDDMVSLGALLSIMGNWNVPVQGTGIGNRQKQV